MQTSVTSKLKTLSHAISLAFHGSCRTVAAARHGVLLLPLPLFWDQLSRLNWAHVVWAEENPPGPDFFTTLEQYIVLRNMAYCSQAHLRLMDQFVLHQRGAPAPQRPRWTLI